jgi:hypothetical protein
MWKVPVCANKQYKGYLVNTEGEIINARQEMVKPRINNRGYYMIDLYDYTLPGEKRTMLVHRIVAETFIPNPMGLETLNHIDGDKSHNSVSNLEWLSMADNNIEAHKIGLVGQFTNYGLIRRDEELRRYDEWLKNHYDKYKYKHHIFILTRSSKDNFVIPRNKPLRMNAETVKRVCQELAMGYSVRYISDELNVPTQTIRSVKRRDSWRDISDMYNF